MAECELIYEDEYVELWCGDGRSFMLGESPQVSAVVTDPPYGDTSLEWDRRVDGWLDLAYNLTPSLWCFGSMRFFLALGGDFREAGWQYGQEVVWEKHNGSGFHADRFKRVHEFAIHWYRGEWSSLYRQVPVTMDATARKVIKRTKGRPTHHLGQRNDDTYVSEDGGPKLMRSVQYVRSEHGRAVHPTQKPTGILRPLIEYSCPPDGIVLDPFAGSASTLIAAREMGRKAIGVEIDPDYCAAAARRLAQQELVAA